VTDVTGRRPLLIAILDDDPERLAGMRAALAALEGPPAVVEFAGAPEMISWLGEHLGECSLISLDHDLGPSSEFRGAAGDPGTGREVVDYLAAREPACPVIVHTSNSLARVGMELALREAGWSFASVHPYFGVDWIGGAWIAEVLRLTT
jgi:hypothetical protein